MSEVSLKEFVDRIFEERERALKLVAQNLEHRLETLNALRADVIKDREQFLTKSVYQEMYNSLDHRLSKIESWQSRIVGAGILLVALSGLLVAVVSHLFLK